MFEAPVSGNDERLTLSRPSPAPSPAVGPAGRCGPFKSLAGRTPEVAAFPARRGPHSSCARAALPSMQALRAGLTLALGAGLGAAAEGWRRRRVDARAPPGLLGRLPVLPVAAAAELPPVPAKPGAPAGAGELAKYGLPGLAQLKSRESYVLCYDPRTRGALWVVEQLRPERLRGDGDRRSCDFREDDSVHAYHRATNADYRGSGFDRGHLAAAANHRWSQKAMEDTFYLSNVAPQVAPAPRPPGASRSLGLRSAEQRSCQVRAPGQAPGCSPRASQAGGTEHGATQHPLCGPTLTVGLWAPP